jgi:hypothetical protein
LLPSWHDGTSEAELRELILTKTPIIHAKEGEFAAFAIHSLNNILKNWQTCRVSLLGPMFEDGIYSEDEAISFACGFKGSHPYNFASKVTPERQAGFNFIRTKLNFFLATNSRWKKAVSFILDSANVEDELSIQIFNPLNFFGMLVDLYRDGETSRIPSAEIVSLGRSHDIHYFGTVIWGGMVSRVRFRDALTYAYQDERIALLRAFNQSVTEYDEKLFHRFSIRHEFFRVINQGTEWLNIDEEPPRWEKSKKSIESLRLFFTKHDCLIEEAGKFFGERSI